MSSINIIKAELSKYADSGKIPLLSRYFKAIPGGYGEGDIFIGVKVPDQRKVAKQHYKNISPDEAELLLKSSVHEYRLTALFIIITKFQKAKSEKEKKEIVDMYLNNSMHINNWDLVDSSADKILGAYLFDK